MKRVFWAAILTVLLCVLGIVGDNSFGVDNAVWKVIESTINFPGTLILKLVGPGHGFQQLVLPFFFSLAFYFCMFWSLIIILQRFDRQYGPRRIPR